MSSNPQERDVARRFGFGRPKPKLSLPVNGEPDVLPSQVLERLGLRAGTRVALVSVTDPMLARLRSGTASLVSSMAPREPVDAIVFQAESAFALRRVTELARFVKRGGCLWVLWPRNHGQVNEAYVQRTGIAAGLTDVKAASVTDRLAGLKFIHPPGDW